MGRPAARLSIKETDWFSIIEGLAKIEAALYR